MKPIQWRILGVGVLGVVALGLVWAGRRPAPDQQAVVPEDPGTRPDLMEEMRQSERLDRRLQVTFWMVGRLQGFTSDLLAGRCNLFEAAAGFRAVQQVTEKYMKPVPPPFPGATEEERLCRQVIVFVEQHLRDEPSRDTFVARLERHLEEHLQRYGTIRLPEPPRFDPLRLEP
jgi:hypothetical protein